MAEEVNGVLFNPSVLAVTDKIADMLYDRVVPVLATEALSVILDSWDSEQGYDISGSPIPWHRSPKSERTNPILFDTGTLKSSISIIYTEDETPFYFKASGKTYDNGNSVEEVSGYNSNNPHDNVPIEYRDGGTEFERIVSVERVLILDDLVADGTIVYL